MTNLKLPRRTPLGPVAVALALSLSCGTRASAADLDPGYPDEPVAMPQQTVSFGSGWYIRGDIGVNRGLSIKGGDEPYDTTGFQTYAGGPTYPRGISEGPGLTPPSIILGRSSNLTYTASVGGGYAFNKWFRADVMFDYHQPVANTSQGIGRPCITGTAGVGAAPFQQERLYSTTCTPTLKAALNGYDALVNGYIDLGTWSIVTPYIGAGVGLSFGQASASSAYIQGNNAPYNVTYTDAINGASYNQYWDRSQSGNYYNLAYALMAGVAIDVYNHTKLDIGYRYLNLGTAFGAKLSTQEIRAGLRYMIDN